MINRAGVSDISIYQKIKHVSQRHYLQKINKFSKQKYCNMTRMTIFCILNRALLNCIASFIFTYYFA